MRPNDYSLQVVAPTCLLCVVSLCFITGCGTGKGTNPRSDTSTAPTSALPSSSPASPVPDESLAVGDYLRLGMPDPGRLWMAADYRDCRDVLYGLDRTNRAALPRMES